MDTIGDAYVVAGFVAATTCPARLGCVPWFGDGARLLLLGACPASDAC